MLNPHTNLDRLRWPLVTVLVLLVGLVLLHESLHWLFLRLSC